MFWIVPLILIIAGFTLLVTFVLPKLFLQNKCAITPHDRFVRKIEENGETTLVYEPALSMRRYINRYLLTRREGKTLLVCKVAQDLKYIDYDIVVYDEHGDVKQMLNAKDAIEKKGYTKVIELCDETAYVSLAINEANGEKFDTNVLGRVTGGRIFLFALLSALIIAVATVGIKASLSLMIGGIFTESLLTEGESVLMTVIIGGAVVLAYVIMTLIAVNSRNKKAKKKEEKG